MKRSLLAERPCPVARASAQLVDAWSFVILRELYLGNRRFEGLRQHTGMSPRSLALRLAWLVEQRILEKAVCQDAPAFQEYRLTPKGLDLWPVMVMLRQWGERWGGARGAPTSTLMHRGRGHALVPVIHCGTCGERVDARSSEVLPTAAGLRERAAAAGGAAGPAGSAVMPDRSTVRRRG